MIDRTGSVKKALRPLEAAEFPERDETNEAERLPGCEARRRPALLQQVAASVATDLRLLLLRLCQREAGPLIALTVTVPE